MLLEFSEGYLSIYQKIDKIYIKKNNKLGFLFRPNYFYLK